MEGLGEGAERQEEGSFSNTLGEAGGKKRDVAGQEWSVRGAVSQRGAGADCSLGRLL